MDERLTIPDARDKNRAPNNSPEPEDGIAQLLRWWDRFWARVTRLGLGDIALRAGSALVTIGLVGLVIWVMKGFFMPSDMIRSEAEPFELAAAGGPVLLPAYEGIAPVAGLSKSANSETGVRAVAEDRNEFTVYTVQAGDSVYSIAERFGLEPATILWTNYATLYDNPAFIIPGQQLNIPPVNGVMWPWVKGNGLNKFSENMGVTPDVIISWPGNNLSPETIGDYVDPNIEDGQMIFVPGGTRPFVNVLNVLLEREETAKSNIWGPGKCAPTNLGPIGTGTYVWPSTERRVSGYTWTPDVGHYGIDIGGKTGNPIYTVDNGVVVYSGWNDWGYGNVIAIDHGNGIQTIYAHLDTLNVACGAFVYQGDTIGTMGSTGNSSGPHLHIEFRENNVHYNPHKYLGY
jgi:murein DD-endopeptidase MepM/ murein hydrolase activator NlpD